MENREDNGAYFSEDRKYRYELWRKTISDNEIIGKSISEAERLYFRGTFGEKEYQRGFKDGALWLKQFSVQLTDSKIEDRGKDYLVLEYKYNDFIYVIKRIEENIYISKDKGAPIDFICPELFKHKDELVIWKVRRLSDNLEFQVGDETQWGAITEFTVNDNKIG